MLAALVVLAAAAVAWAVRVCWRWWACDVAPGTAPTTGAREPPRLPGAMPLLGHTLKVVWSTADGVMDMLEIFAKESLEVGGVGTTTFGPQKVYAITDPEVARAVLNTCMEKDTLYHFFRSWFKRGLFSRPFEGYLERRKLLMPGFSQKTLDGFYDIIDSKAIQLTDSLIKLAGTGPINLEAHLSMFTLHTILMTQLGMTEGDLASLHDKMAYWLEATQDMLKLVLGRFLRFWCHIPWIYERTHHWKKEQGLLNVLHGLSEEVVRRRMLALEEKIKTCEHDDKKSETQSPIFLDTLLQLAKRGVIDLTEVREEVDGVMFAGHDTSAGTLQFACVLLAAHPEVQETLYTELKEVLGDSEHITKQHLSSLNYTEAVLKETMRLYPVAAIYGRLIDKDIRIDQYVLRAGSKAVVLPLGLHRHPAWGDGEEFRPARWLAAAQCDAFMPFSSGRRSCIGKLYSMAVMKTALARVVQRCRLTPAAPLSPLRLEFRILLKPVSGHLVNIQLRQ